MQDNELDSAFRKLLISYGIRDQNQLDKMGISSRSLAQAARECVEICKSEHHQQTIALLERLREQGAALTVPDKKGNHIPWWPDGFKPIIDQEIAKLKGEA